MAVDLPVPLSSEALNELGQFEQEFRVQEKNVAFIQNENPYDLAVNREYFSFHKTDITSIIVVPLGLEQKMLGQGSFFFVTQGDNDSQNKLYTYAFSNNDRFKSISKLILKK